MIAVLAIAAAAALTTTTLLAPFENWSMDRRLATRGERGPDARVAVVAINQPSLNALKERWPIRRRHYAELVDRLRAAGVKVIAFTTEFDAETDPADDTPMIEAMRRAGNVVLAASAADSLGETNILGGPEARRYARVRVGMANVPADSDKTIRHVPWSVQGQPAFPLEVSRRFGRSPDRDAFHGGRAWIDVRGAPCAPDRPRDCVIPTYGLSDVLNMTPARVRLAFAGKVVVVGVTANGVNRPLPVWGPGRDLTSTPHLAALTVGTALAGFPLRQASATSSVLLLILGGALPGMLDVLFRWVLGGRRRTGNPLNGWFGALLTGAAGLVATAVVAAIAVWSFTRAHAVVVPLGAPLAAAFFATAASVAQRYVADTLNAQMLLAAADSVVPREYVGDLLERCADPSRYAVDTTRGTVIFVDVVGFTAFTTALMRQEGKDAGACAIEVHRFVSAYQALVIAEVFEHDGVIVDLMGDGVLAAFGLVGHADDHETQALLTAHSTCTAVVQTMRSWLEEQGWNALLAEHRRLSGETEGGDRFDVRVGLDSGELAVGLTGHQARFEFAVIGPATIGAARLQAEAKALGVTLCASHRTYSDRLSAQARALVPAAPQDAATELRGQKGWPTLIHTWTRDDTMDEHAARDVVLD